MSKQDDLRGFINRARELDATDAKVISPATVVTAAWVRFKCRYGCGGYGTSLCCPPHSPTPDETRAVLDGYMRALLLHCARGVDVTDLAATLEREVFLAGYYKAFAFGAGPCNLCRECNLESCAHPYEARPAMEACGIDVFATARANGFPIEVVTDRGCEANHYGLVVVD